MREKSRNSIRKLLICILSAATVLMMSIADVEAATLTKYTVVYITKTGSTYHLKSDCRSMDSKRPYAKTLYDILNGGQYKMCSTCAKEFGVSSNDAQSLTLDMLPYELRDDVTVVDMPSENEQSESSGETQQTESSGSEVSSGSGSEVSSGSGSEGSSNSSESGGSSNSTESSSDSADSVNLSENNNSNNNNTESKSNTQNTTKKTTTGKSKSSLNSNSKSNSKSSSGGDLMTEKQRRNKFRSKTNPKRGAKPKVAERPAADGFEYANFAKFNSYNSDNGLGGTPIYLTGSVKDMQPVKQNGSAYSVAVMVDDIDGYQWYMRCTCDKSKYDALRAELMGKKANICGTYAGYSGVTNRPMMDILRVYEFQGNDVDMNEYK